MATRKKITPKLVAADSTYIDPLNCDSTVSYKIVRSRNVWGSVKLSDCTRSIEWFFGSHEPIAKLDKAIETLQAFRMAYVAAQAATPKRVRRTIAR